MAEGSHIERAHAGNAVGCRELEVLLALNWRRTPIVIWNSRRWLRLGIYLQSSSSCRFDLTPQSRGPCLKVLRHCNKFSGKPKRKRLKDESGSSTTGDGLKESDAIL